MLLPGTMSFSSAESALRAGSGAKTKANRRIANDAGFQNRKKMSLINAGGTGYYRVCPAERAPFLIVLPGLHLILNLAKYHPRKIL